jgi:hypothetical protein
VSSKQSVTTSPGETDRARRLGVALSGGGSRAALFGLGSLLFLKDAGLAENVVSISSVSGSSVLNAHAARNSAFSQGSVEEFDAHVSSLAGLLTRRGFRWSAAGWLVFGIAAALVGLIVLAGRPIEVPFLFRIVLAALWPVGLLIRRYLVGLTLSWRLLGDRGSAFRWDTEREIEHVFGATDLNCSEPFYFSTWNGGHVFSPQRRWSAVGRISPSMAIAASSARPGGFGPKRARWDRRGVWQRARLDLKGGRARDSSGLAPAAAYLVDGSIWDNLGTGWFFGWGDRRAAARQYRDDGGESPMPQDGVPDEILVVAASRPPLPMPRHGRGLALLWELISQKGSLRLMRDSAVVVGSATLRRATRLHLTLDPMRVVDHSLPVSRVAVASIEDQLPTSHDVMTENHVVSVTPRPSSAMREAAARAESMSATLPVGSFEFPDGDWINIARLHALTSCLKTTFGRLSDRHALLIVMQGYLAAMTQCAVVFDLPTSGGAFFPGVERFSELLGTRPPDIPTVAKRRLEPTPTRRMRRRAPGNLDPTA